MTIVEISVRDAKKLMQENKTNSNFVILDVRTKTEFAEEHLDGVVNIDIYDDNFKKKLEKLDKKKTYLVHCHAGVRCFMAAEIMKNSRFTKIYSVSGILFE